MLLGAKRCSHEESGGSNGSSTHDEGGGSGEVLAHSAVHATLSHAHGLLGDPLGLVLSSLEVSVAFHLLLEGLLVGFLVGGFVSSVDESARASALLAN